MHIELRFFAGVREALGKASEQLVVPAAVETVDAVRRHLIERGGVWADALGPQQVLRMAYNHQMVEDGNMCIEEGCEIAFFPPVTGG
jgi:sulfur-carrier protein